MFGRNKETLSGRVDTLIAAAARIAGDVEFAGGLHLDGRVVGNVVAVAGNNASLWISEKGQVEGNIEVPNVILNGIVRGDVIARDKLMLGPKARITGNVSYGSMEMAQGSQVSGRLTPIAPVAKQSASQDANQTADQILSQNASPPNAAAAFAPAAALKAVPGNFDGRRSAS
jgi:cytoskeletal protein CcmA (bactofilin family)